MFRILKPLVRSCLLVFSLLALPALAQPDSAPEKPMAEKVRLQLKWFHQFQFAGYYAAIEQGYYAEEGLNVEIVERALEKNFVKQVSTGESNYGVGDSGLLFQYAQGEPIVALAAIFQHNPLVFFARQDSGIISPYEMAGKRIMSDIISTNEAPLRAMLAGAKITEKDYTLLPQKNEYDLLTRREVDVISGYLTDQPFYFKKKGLKINIINPQNYGIDFYGDILFTSQQELNDHPGRAERFRRASLKGWRYALDHPEELIQIIHHKYQSNLPLEHLRFEAAETRKLILPDAIPLGQIESSRMKMVADAYAGSGLSKRLNEADLAGFIYSDKQTGLNLTEGEKAWLAAHRVIRVGIDRDFAPYEWIDQNGHYVGLAADYMRLLEKKLGVTFEIVKNKPWAEVLQMAKRGEIDMLSCVVKTPERSQYLTFTAPYKSAYALIIDNGQGNFIGNLDQLKGKRVAIENGYFMQEMLQKNHPHIHLVPAQDTQEALNFVIRGKADAYVGDAGTANYAIKKGGLLSLRFSGQTDYRSQHSVAVTKNNPELATIVAKAMESIPQDEVDAIFTRWLGLRIEQGIKSETLVKYGLVALAIFLLFVYWTYRLRREIANRKLAEKTLQISEARLRAVMDNSPFLIWLKDKDGRYLAVNIPWLHAAGRTNMEEVIGKTDLDLWPQALAGKYRADDAEVMASRKQKSIEELALNDGKEYWSETFKTPVIDIDGNMLGTAGFSRDITTRRQVEQVLKESEEKFRMASAYTRSLIEASLDPLVTISAEGKITDVNKATERVTGYTREELIGTDFSSYFTEPENAQRGYQHVFSDGFVTDYPLSVRHKNGHITDVLYNASIFKSENGEIRGVFASARDISHQKMIEDALRENQERLLHMLETSPIAVRIATKGGTRVLFANQRYTELINAEAHQVIGANPKNYYANPQDYEEVLQLLEHGESVIDKLIELHIPGEMSKGYSGRNPGDKIVWAMASYLKMDYRGEPAVLGWFYDVSDLRKAKEMAEGIAKTKAEFLANMSHEIRTPMNAIIGLTHLALNKEISQELRDYLEKIRNSSDSLLHILNDILDLSKAEAGRIAIRNTSFDLTIVINNIRNMFAHRAEEKYLDFEIIVAPDVPCKLVGDALRIQQILTNLVGNALKFTEHGSVALNIDLRQIDQSKARLCFTVTDTGIGISGQDREKLFLPFSQADGSITRRFGGTGLGLAISHHLLQLMGSDFIVESAPGKGSTFSFELVLEISALSVQPELEKPRLEQNPAGFDKALTGARVLVAEDNAINQQVVMEFLRLSGIEAKVANNGKEALDLLEQECFDAILMDVHMPIMGGVEATQIIRIRKQDRHADIPIIALTAGVTQEEQEKCLANGMNDFVAKPINPDQLIATLRQWIKSADSTPIAITLPQSLAGNAGQTDKISLTVLDRLSGFDLGNLLAMLGNNASLATQLLHSFKEDMKNLPDNIEAAITDGNLASAKALAHKIKGAAGNVGATILHDAASTLETELKAQYADPDTFSAFREAFDQAMSVIAALRQPESDPALPPTGVNRETLRQAFADLDLLLKENDFVTESLLNDIKSHLSGDRLNLFADLRHAINSIQYAEARKILRQISDLPDAQ